MDTSWQPQQGEFVPSEAYPQSYSPQPQQYDGQMLNPIPAPPADEGNWNSPAPSMQSIPRSIPEPDVSAPLETTNWLPARLP